MSRRPKLTQREIATVLLYRKNKKDIDRMRSPGVVAKYRRFLVMYDRLRKSPGVWFDLHGVASVMGLSDRHARRWISLMLAMDYPGIEVEYSLPHGVRPASRMRYNPEGAK